MAPFRLATIVTLATTLIALAPTASATGSAEVTDATGSLQKMLMVDGSPVPTCWIWWYQPAGVVTQFHPVLQDNIAMPICAGDMMVRCESDTLAYAGWWPEYELSSPSYFRFLSVEAELEVTLHVTSSTRVTAQRSFVGAVPYHEHTATISPEDGADIVLLPAEGGPDEAEAVLEPGDYHLVISVLVSTGSEALDAYDGSVTIAWVDESTPVEARSWGAVKGLFR